MRVTLGSEMEGCDGVLVHRMKCSKVRSLCSCIVMAHCHCAMMESNKTQTETFFLPWIRTSSIMAVVVEPQWELKLIGYQFRVTVRNLASHSRDASVRATPNHGGLLSTFAFSFCFHTGSCAVATQRWFEWPCDIDLFLRAEVEIRVLGHSLM